MTSYEITLNSQPQKLTVSLAGVQYTLIVLWNTINGTWVIDLEDSSGNPILTGIPLVPNIDLLEQFAYLNIGGSLVVQTDGNVNALPTFDNLGIGSHLYFVVA